jgi:TPR repeat protein
MPEYRCTPGPPTPELQTLAYHAEAGDKHAQLELGIRYEEGHGVGRDLDRATRLYRLAAADSGGAIHVYSPPVGQSGRGRVIPVPNGQRAAGLAEARARLERVRQ